MNGWKTWNLGGIPLPCNPTTNILIKCPKKVSAFSLRTYNALWSSLRKGLRHQRAKLKTSDPNAKHWREASPSCMRPTPQPLLARIAGHPALAPPGRSQSGTQRCAARKISLTTWDVSSFGFRAFPGPKQKGGLRWQETWRRNAKSKGFR